MRRSIIIAEDFYDDPEKVVAYAKTLPYMCPYNTVEQDAAGEKIAWRASRWQPASACPFKSSESLISKLEFLTGESIDRGYWNLDFPVDDNGYPVAAHRNLPHSAWWNCVFHTKHHDQRIGDGVHSHTDRDGWNAVGENGWAGLIYLDVVAPRQSGLRTWENIDSSHRFDWMTSKENWILCDTFANVFNRLILHRGDIPHSGSAGWGRTVADGRFYQTLFFRTAPKHYVEGVSVPISLTVVHNSELASPPR